MKERMITITIFNDETGDEDIGNYRYLVRIGKHVIHEGQIRNHVRKKGLQGLVYALTMELEKSVIGGSFSDKSRF